MARQQLIHPIAALNLQSLTFPAQSHPPQSNRDSSQSTPLTDREAGAQSSDNPEKITANDIAPIEGQASEIKAPETKVSETKDTETKEVKSSLASEDRRQGDRRKQADRRGTLERRTGGETNSIRVSTQKIDTLINRVGELVITQSMLGQVSDNIETLNQKTINRLKEGLVQLERNTREIQEDVMQIRMLPISFVFNRFPRLVHDLQTQLGKRIELVISGEGTELDKTLMEKISDPLVHLVRNSIDHGIEMPKDRKAAINLKQDESTWKLTTRGETSSLKSEMMEKVLI